MSQQQYNNLMSTILKEKCALAKLRAELEERKGKLCQCCKKFGYLACNCRNRKEEGKVPQNKFEVLKTRVMQCGAEEKTIRRQEMIVVECFKCGEKRHKHRECPLWEKRERVVHAAKLQRAYQQERRLVCPIREKA